MSGLTWRLQVSISSTTPSSKSPYAPPTSLVHTSLTTWTQVVITDNLGKNEVDSHGLQLVVKTDEAVLNKYVHRLVRRLAA